MVHDHGKYVGITHMSMNFHEYFNPSMLTVAKNSLTNLMKS